MNAFEFSSQDETCPHVDVCAWNPKYDIIASASSEAVIRIMEPYFRPIIIERPNGAPRRNFRRGARKIPSDFTTLDWHPNGEILASGGNKGHVHLWTRSGNLKRSLEKQESYVKVTKFNKSGSYLACCSRDSLIKVSDTSNGQRVRTFEFHHDTVFDVDWRDDSRFISCSADKSIHLCNINKTQPVVSYYGHLDDVNFVRFDPSGMFFASNSADLAAQVWNVNNNKPVFDLKRHGEEVYALQWLPNSTVKPLLATADIFSNVKLWDVNAKTCIRTVTNNPNCISSFEFCPNSHFLAVASFDKTINIWCVLQWKLLTQYEVEEEIFYIEWNSTGDKLAVCLNDNSLVVVNVKTSNAVNITR